jgi:hypothetical protein
LFLSKLAILDWAQKLKGDVNEKVEIFNSTVNKLYCSCFPLKTKLLSTKRLFKPWLTKGILNSIHTKAQYFKMSKLGIIDDKVNVAYKNRLTATIKAAKTQYYKKYI